MKKNFRYIILILIPILYLNGCESNTDITGENIPEETPPLSDIASGQLTADNSIENPYFFDMEDASIEYEGFFNPLSYNEIEQNVNLNIKKIKTFENTILYALELDQLDVTSSWDGILDIQRFLGYFYVTEDIVYRIDYRTAYDLLRVVTGESYIDNDELPQKMISLIEENEAEFLAQCIIVCNENGTENIAAEDGYHQFVEVDGEKRIFRTYNDNVSATTVYQTIVWERGRGITHYQQGFGSRIGHMEFGIDLSDRGHDNTAGENIPAEISRPDSESGQAIMDNPIENPYFFNEEDTRVEYEGFINTLNGNEVEQNIGLTIKRIKIFEDAALFTLELDQLDVADPLLDGISWGRRYLGYFYVTADAIYRMEAPGLLWEQQENGFTDELTQKVIHLIEENKEDFLAQSVIVCNENGTENIADEDGGHEYIEVAGEKRIFHLYNDYVGGTRAYQQIVWERGKGIIYYKYGEGSMLMHVEFGVDLPDTINSYEY